jgi:glucosamine-6-phosphate deaminase
MEIIIQETKEAAAEVAARIIAGLLREKPGAVIGLATGSTPLPLYRRLIEMNLDWSEATTFNLDEYIGLPREHPQSYHSFMWENLFRHINIRREHVHIPDGNAEDVPRFCKEYEEHIRNAGGIKTLTQQTIADNARFFGSAEQVPRHVITMGIGTIMEARQNLLLAFGESKAQAVAEAVEGPITSINPASILQMHPVAKMCLDEGAASRLRRIDYYRWVYDNKPGWQAF